MLAMSRDLGLSYKAAFVLAHKLRAAMAEEMKGRTIGDDRPAFGSGPNQQGGWVIVVQVSGPGIAIPVCELIQSRN